MNNLYNYKNIHLKKNINNYKRFFFYKCLIKFFNYYKH